MLLKKINSFGIIGGDKRQLEVAKSIARDGYSTVICGFEKMEHLDIQNNSLENAMKCEGIILPLPATKNGRNVNATFSEKDIILDESFAKQIKGKPIFCGMKGKLLDSEINLDSSMMFDYFDREEFTVLNAVPTAEGAIQIAMEQYSGTINGAKCLVTGFGRIGKILAKMLQGMGANVSVSARKKKDIAWIQLLGYTPIDNKDLTVNGSYDLIFNTVPYMVLNARTLAHIAENALVIDLASMPGGTDFACAERLGIHTVHALALPGKVAPKTAGEIIKNTIYNIIEEEDN